MARVLVQGRADLTTKASGSTPIQLAEAYGKQDSALSWGRITVLVRKDQTVSPEAPRIPPLASEPSQPQKSPYQSL